MYDNQLKIKKSEEVTEGFVREMIEQEYPLLNDFLYDAIFQNENENKLPYSVIEQPALRQYVHNFGSMDGDYALCFQTKAGLIIGAIWVRNIQGYGSIDDLTVELSMSVKEKYRGLGVGRRLLKRMLEDLKKFNHSEVSLSVQKQNNATRLYFSEGFKIFSENEEEYILTFSIK